MFVGSRVRGRVVNKLKADFITINDAEEHFGLTLSDILEDLMPKPIETSATKAIVTCNKVTQTAAVSTTGELCPATPANTAEELMLEICKQTEKEQFIILNRLFLDIATVNGISSNPSDFISLAPTAMSILQRSGKSNLLYKFAYCLATQRPDGNWPLWNIARMPFGLVEYQIEFFSCTNVMQVLIILYQLILIMVTYSD